MTSNRQSCAPVLELQELSLLVRSSGIEHPLLAGIGARFPRTHFAAVMGPSGCGKSTLLKVIAGVHEHTGGAVRWDGRDLVGEGDLDPHEIGYVPQFSIAFELLTVWENLEAALRLRVAGVADDEAQVRLQSLLSEVGLTEIGERPVRLLSGGQRRRLALALEMISSPHLLLCDEVTSGLDPNAEDEVVKVMHDLSRSGERIVLNVTHSLRHLHLHDTVLVLHEGHLVYHGAPATLLHYFGIDAPEQLFPQLGSRSVAEWHEAWLTHRDDYYREAGLERAASEFSTDGLPKEPQPHGSPAEPARSEKAAMPGLLTQFRVLLGRRWKLFFRDRGHVALQLALLFGFPMLVVIFALSGLPQLPNANGSDRGSFLAQIMADAAQRKQFVDAGTLVSGLVMFQVVLLALMGSNNAAREIAGERAIFEKEKFAGLRPSAYVLSKAAFLGVIVCAQSIWMTVFVHWVVDFPGDLGTQCLVLILVNGAMSAICLALSSILRTAEQASLVSIYIVGFQLPLSGALLALLSLIHI